MDGIKLMGHIYGIKKLDEDRIVYVGQTTRNYKIRWQQHKQQKDRPYALYRAFDKYGIENFAPILLEECDNIKLNEREIYWIQYYHTFIDDGGYNLTRGGDSNSNNQRKPVYQYSLDGIFIQKFNSIQEAQDTMTPNSQGGSIFKAVHNVIHQAYGYRWSFQKQEKLIDPYIPMQTYQIAQYSLSGELLNYFPSIHQAACAIGKPQGSSNIIRAADGKCKTAYGFRWQRVAN